MFSTDRITALIKEALPDCQCRVTNRANDGKHFAAEVASSAFLGLPLVRQHQLVYGALGDHMRSDIHALELRTFTPERWPHGAPTGD